ncbi:hypothetical protein BOX15_Mlig004184g1 [Macrostomum lignano]|uniref:Peptidase_M13 domain-containing protein n=1 Tax=Macrostomum lignano TaxID=282301 RepID=A0A267ER98_9PLAT|nr:hypothetical protein BOX15_Mlig004184g1 [Macrostomum lignano]
MENPDDKYKIFDSSDLQGGAAAGRVIGFDSTGVVVLQRRFTYTAAFGLLAVGLGCLLGVVFLMLFSVSSVRAGQLQAQVQALRQAQSETCRTEQCLQQAAYLTKIMNHSANPCDDFYEYACGNYDKMLPYDHWFAYTSVFHEMDRKAQDDIETALSKPTADDSPNWERKVKDYYWTCVQYYRTYIHDENPFITQVLNKTDHGGLGNYLLGRSLDTASVDLMFRTVSGKYFVPSLFSARSHWNDYLHKSNSDWKYTIWVGSSSRGVGIIRYNLYYSRHQDIYKRFVKEVAELLIRDSKMNVPNQAQVVETFASDVLYVEQQLLQIHSDSWPSQWMMFMSSNPSHPDRMLKVSDLTNRMSSLIDFKAFLSSIYGQDKITDNTKVVMYSEVYMDKLNTLLTQMKNNNTQEYNRKIGNFLTWVLASFFEWDLSPEYRLKFKSIRDITWYTYNPEENAHDFCFSNSRWGMKKALSGLYVKEYFSEASRDKANTLFEHLRKAAKDGIDQVGWMDDDTKRLAKQRVDSIVEKSGYPDQAKDNNYLDREFQRIDTSKDYFSLLLSSIEYLKNRQVRLLTDRYDPQDLEHWGQLWDTHFSYHLYDNELLVQAGILQAPLFSKNLPQQLVYGGMGTLLAHEIYQSFDVNGQRYSKSVGYQRKGWWSASAVNEYTNRVTCLRDSLRELLEYYEQDRLGDLSAEEREQKIKDLLKNSVNWTAVEIGAIKSARRAFDVHKNDVDSTHVRLPVYDNTEEQMFYISYAQMNCHHIGVYYDYRSWRRNWFPWKILVNAAISHVPEFGRTFSCKRGSRLSPEKRCDVF